MKLIKTTVVTLAIAVFGFAVVAPAATTYALDPLGDQCAGNSDNAICESKDDNANDLIKIIVNTMLFIIGALSVIMIIWGGIAYAISAGDPAKVTKAKNTITYAVLGLIIAFLAYAIVNWVVLLFQ